MRSANLASTVLSFLLIAAPIVSAQETNQTEASSTTTSEKVASTISAEELDSTDSTDSSITTTSKTLEPTSTAEETCSCSVRPIHFSWDWPKVNVTEILVAKVIVKVDRTTNETTTVTSYIKEDATGVAQKPEDVWNLALNTTGITMSDGNAVLTLTRSIVTGVDEEDFFTTTQRIVHPTAILDWGYRAIVTDSAEFETITSPLETRITTCAAEGSVETIAMTPAGDDYKVVVAESEWDSMLPEDLRTRCGRGIQLPIGSIDIQSALTETTTEYDDYQQSQVTSSSKKSDPTTPSSVKATTTTAEKEPVKEETSQNLPPSSQQPTQNQPTQNEPSQNQPTQNQPDQNSPTPPASSFTSTQTSTYTPVILGGATLTAGGPAATISGTTYSLGASSDLVVNGNTLDLVSSQSTGAATGGGEGGEGGLGTLIWEGLGGTVVTASQTGPVTATTVATFTGAASRVVSGWVVSQAVAITMAAAALCQVL